MNIKDKILECVKNLYINNNNHFSYCLQPMEDCSCRSVDINLDTNLYGEGYLDSMSFLHLSLEIEKQFNIKIDNNFLTPNNFKSVNNIEKIILQYL